jgi:hypothetical protein
VEAAAIKRVTEKIMPGCGPISRTAGATKFESLPVVVKPQRICSDAGWHPRADPGLRDWPEASRLQLAFELVQKAPVRGVGDDLVGA